MRPETFKYIGRIEAEKDYYSRVGRAFRAGRGTRKQKLAGNSTSWRRAAERLRGFGEATGRGWAVAGEERG
jgi:hypothetical protein